MEDYKIVDAKPVKLSFTKRNSVYFSTLWNISLFLGGAWGIYSWFVELFNSAKSGNVLLFIFQLILQSVLISLFTLIAAFILFIGLVAVTFFPYILYRGLKN